MKPLSPKIKGNRSVGFLCCLTMLFISLSAFSQITVSSFTPTTVTQRTTVTIVGSNFVAPLVVTFNGVAATSFTIISPTEIRAVVGTGAAGKVRVTKGAVFGESTADLIYISPSATTSGAAINRVISDFNGYWSSIATSSLMANQPDMRHNLTAFGYNGAIYSTGVDNSALTAHSVSFIPSVFKAFSTDGITGSTPAAGGSNFIALGAKIDGNSTVGLPSSPQVSGLTVRDVLIDGINGLDLGTGVTNVSSNMVMAFDVSNIVAASITDSTPDVLITQTASPSANADVYSFVDSNGNIVGNSISADLGAITAVGTYRLDLFTLPASTLYATATINGLSTTNTTRDIRMIAFKLSDFGITAANSGTVAKFKLMPGGDSDPAFIAYNTNTFLIGLPIISVYPISQVICSGSAGAVEFTVTAIGTGLTYQWKKNNVNIAGAVLPTYVISAPTAASIASYSVVVSNVYGSVVGTATLTNGVGETTWNGLTWSNGVPTPTINAVFNGNYNSSGNISGCSCTINSGANVTLLANHVMTLQNEIKVLSGGSIVLNNAASLVQVNEAAINSGNIQVKRDTPLLRRYDYTYWSSPVSPQTLHDLSPLTLSDKYFKFDAALDNWVTIPGTTQMEKGKGYIIRAPQTFSATAGSPYQATMNGIPNNGHVASPVLRGANKWSLIGNPYPSGLSADMFLSDPTNETAISGTIYLWTHSALPNSTGNYIEADYAKWNLTGATRATGPTSILPTGMIASGQSFFVEGVAGSGNANVVFKNTMRVGSGNNTFFRTANTSASNEAIEKHRFWLNLENNQASFNQALIGYIESATNGIDRAFDGKMFGGNATSLYSMIESTPFSIQGRALPFDENDNVALGFTTTTAGTFSISLDHFDGLFGGQNIYLKDNFQNVEHDLKLSAYNFASAIGTFENRFEIVYKSETLGTNNPSPDQNSIVVYRKNKAIFVNAGTTVIRQIRIIDMQGRLIYENKNVNDTQAIISSLPDSEQIFIVQVQSGQGAKIAKKIVY